jgi:hypothetical protein
LDDDFESIEGGCPIFGAPEDFGEIAMVTILAGFADDRIF